MSGQLLYMMGASGVGKDSLLTAIQAELPSHIKIMPRWETRLSTGRDNVMTVTKKNFLAKQGRGEFALSWQAHGFYYGIDRRLDELLEQGDSVLVNGSREYSVKVYQRYPQTIFLHIYADMGILAQRLQQRGRENVVQIQSRLERNQQLEKRILAALMAQQATIVTIDNSGLLRDAVEQLRQAFHRYKIVSDDLGLSLIHI